MRCFKRFAVEIRSASKTDLEGGAAPPRYSVHKPKAKCRSWPAWGKPSRPGQKDAWVALRRRSLATLSGAGGLNFRLPSGLRNLVSGARNRPRARFLDVRVPSPSRPCAGLAFEATSIKAPGIDAPGGAEPGFPSRCLLNDRILIFG